MTLPGAGVGVGAGVGPGVGVGAGVGVGVEGVGEVGVVVPELLPPQATSPTLADTAIAATERVAYRRNLTLFNRRMARGTAVLAPEHPRTLRAP